MNQVVALSGGKDSTAMLHMMIEKGESIHKVYAFVCDWDFPQMRKHLHQVESNTGLHIEKICHYRRFDDLLKHYGWPKSNGGWCTACKRDAAIKYERAVKADVVCIGFAANEKKRAVRPSIQAKRKWKVRFPLIEWGISEAAALQYCYDLGYTWDGLYQVFNRVSCFCCPKAGKNQIEKLKADFPKFYIQYQQKDKLALQGEEG